MMGKGGKGMDLAVVFGGAKKPKGEEESAEDASETEEDEGLSPAFEAAITEAFPELAESPDRMLAMKRAIKECVDSY